MVNVVLHWPRQTCVQPPCPMLIMEIVHESGIGSGPPGESVIVTLPVYVVNCGDVQASDGGLVA